MNNKVAPFVTVVVIVEFCRVSWLYDIYPKRSPVLRVIREFRVPVNVSFYKVIGQEIATPIDPMYPEVEVLDIMYTELVTLFMVRVTPCVAPKKGPLAPLLEVVFTVPEKVQFLRNVEL